MPIKPNVRTGNVDWTGENPGMLLKTDPAGDWSVLMLFFRIVWSPVGPGNILLLYEAPPHSIAEVVIRLFFTARTIFVWQPPQVSSATRRSPGFMNFINAGD